MTWCSCRSCSPSCGRSGSARHPPCDHRCELPCSGSALVVAIGWPGLRGYGNKSDNATIHPLDYGSAVLTVLDCCGELRWRGRRGVSCGEATDRAPSIDRSRLRLRSNTSNTRS